MFQIHVPIVVVEVNQTCGACPAQWEGRTSDGRFIYARYRHGMFRVGVSDDELDAVDAAYSRPLLAAEKGGPLDGVMTYDDLKDWTAGLVVWP